MATRAKKERASDLLTVNLQPSLRTEMERLATAEKLSLGEITRRALTSYLNANVGTMKNGSGPVPTSKGA
jgi:Trp operon repressor